MLLRTTKEAMERSQFDNPYLANELAAWVVNGGDMPMGDLGPRDAALLYTAVRAGLSATFGESSLLGVDSEYLRRLDEAAPI